jgi:hypothetical protein
LLMTSKSVCVMPGPPLRGILSPPQTSITWIVKSASSRLKHAARLSPPDSMKRSWGLNFACSSSRASRFEEISSRMAACGQPPVSTARMRSAGSAPCLVRNSPSSFVKMSLVRETRRKYFLKEVKIYDR